MARKIYGIEETSTSLYKIPSPSPMQADSNDQIELRKAFNTFSDDVSKKFIQNALDSTFTHTSTLTADILTANITTANIADLLATDHVITIDSATDVILDKVTCDTVIVFSGNVTETTIDIYTNGALNVGSKITIINMSGNSAILYIRWKIGANKHLKTILFSAVSAGIGNTDYAIYTWSGIAGWQWATGSPEPRFSDASGTIIMDTISNDTKIFLNGTNQIVDLTVNNASKLLAKFNAYNYSGSMAKVKWTTTLLTTLGGTVDAFLVRYTNMGCVWLAGKWQPTTTIHHSNSYGLAMLTPDGTLQQWGAIYITMLTAEHIYGINFPVAFSTTSILDHPINARAIAPSAHWSFSIPGGNAVTSAGAADIVINNTGPQQTANLTWNTIGRYR